MAEEVKEPKYKILLDQTKEFEGRTLYRVYNNDQEAQGGWVQGEHNLSQDGYCFIYDDCVVMDDARLEGDAILSCDVIVRDRAVVKGEANLQDNVVVRDDAVVTGRCCILGWTVIEKNAMIDGEIRCEAGGQITITDNAILTGKPVLKDYACVSGNGHLAGDAVLEGGFELRTGSLGSGTHTAPTDQPVKPVVLGRNRTLL